MLGIKDNLIQAIFVNERAHGERGVWMLRIIINIDDHIGCRNLICFFLNFSQLVIFKSGFWF